MSLIIRSMQPNEVREVHKLMKKAFGVMEGLFVPKPKMALVAVIDERIVGAFAYDFENAGGRKVGFASVFVTHPDFQGQGIGKRICEEGVKYLWEQGCDELVTYVRDDNVASWGVFEKNGFKRASFVDTARIFGAVGAVKLYVKTVLAFCMGHDFYIASKDGAQTSVQENKSSIGQIAIFLLINVLLAVPIAVASRDTLMVLPAFAAVLAGSVAASYLGTLFSKRRWDFRAVDGGMGVFLAVSLLIRGYLPMVGNWYPEKYENTPKFKRDMAMTAIVPWVFLIGLYAVCLAVNVPVASFITGMLPILLLYRCMAFAPISSYGGGRVYDWNKAVFGILVVISLTLIFVLPRIGVL